MADILQKFEFDDTPGLESLRKLEEGFNKFSDSVDKLTENLSQMSENVGKNVQDIDKTMDNSAKKIGRTAGIYAELARQTAIFFGKAVAGLGELSKENDRIAEGQEKIAKKSEEVRKVLADKLAPIFYVIQQTTIQLLDKVLKTGGDIQNSVIVKIAAGIKGIQAAVGQAFKNLGNNIKISINEFKILGKNIQAIFSRGDKKDSIRGEIEALRKENAELAKETRYIGDAYKEAYDQAKKSITDLVNSGYFQLKRATKEELERLKKLREEYARLVDQINDRIEKSRIAVAEGLKAIDLERDAVLREIDAIEERAKKLAEATGQEFELQEKFNELRRNTEIDFQQKRKELIDKTNLEIAQDSRRRFKEAFGIYFEDLDELGRKAAAKQNKDLLATIRKQNDAIQKNVEKISKEYEKLGDKGIFDQFKEKLFGSLGLSSEEGDLITGITTDVLSKTQELFTANIDRRIADNERLLDSIRERRNVLQNELDEELKLQAIGRENNVKSKQEELAKLAAQEQKAQKEREQLEKKQRRAQFAADLVQQVSSLTTAAANVFKANSNIPIVGVILGIAAVAALFAAFNAAKNKAASAAKATNPLYRGGSLKGKLQNKSGFVNWLHGRPDKPGHGQGHRIEDSNIILGGREMIVAEEPANHQSDNFWDNMNSGRYNSLDLESTLDDHMTNPKTINTNFEKRQVKIVKIREANKKTGYVTKDEMTKIIQQQTKEMIRYFESKPEYVAFSEDQKIARIRKSSKEVNVSDSKEIFKAS